MAISALGRRTFDFAKLSNAPWREPVLHASLWVTAVFGTVWFTIVHVATETVLRTPIAVLSSMPGMSGTDLARQALLLRPAMPVILLTGFSGAWNAENIRSIGVRELLLKPLAIDELAAAVERALTNAAVSQA